MRIALIFVFCVLFVVTVDCSNGNGPDDCCFKFYPRRINKTLVRSYYMTDHRCPKTAVILVTNKSRNICVDPSLSWVENIMKNVDERNF